MECCMCWRQAKASTTVVNGEYFGVCRLHFNLWVKTPEEIGLRAWCRRITSPVLDGVRPIGRSVLCDFIDAHAVIC